MPLSTVDGAVCGIIVGVEEIVTGATEEPVFSRSTGEGVVPIRAEWAIIAGSTSKNVISGPADD